MPTVRLSPSGPELDIDSLDMPPATLAGRPRDGIEGQAEALTPDQSVQVLTQADIAVPSWDFNGVIAAAGALSVPGWTAYNNPTIIQRGVGAGHSANHPGQLQLQLSATLADKGCVFYGPYDFSTISRVKATVLIPAAGGSELTSCAFGFGLVSDPTDMNSVFSSGVWIPNQVICQVRSDGVGPGQWITRVSNGGASATTLSETSVALGTWYPLELRKLSADTWGLYLNDVALPGIRPGAPTSGLCYLAVGGIRGVGAAAGRNIVCDITGVETTPLDRSAA